MFRSLKLLLLSSLLSIYGNIFADDVYYDESKGVLIINPNISAVEQMPQHLSRAEKECLAYCSPAEQEKRVIDGHISVCEREVLFYVREVCPERIQYSIKNMELREKILPPETNVRKSDSVALWISLGITVLLTFLHPADGVVFLFVVATFILYPVGSKDYPYSSLNATIVLLQHIVLFFTILIIDQIRNSKVGQRPKSSC